MDATQLLAEVATVAGRLGDTAVAQRARAQASHAGDSAVSRVIVVGEKKRGKSSLLNALVEVPGLLPVDSDVATSAHIVVHAADAPQARAVVAGGGPDGIAIGIDEVGEYAALDPQTGELRHPDVQAVHVGIPSGLLKSGLTLIDTPGVGGLVSGHAQLTLAALAMADALLFVVNGASELTASECEFLAQATERVPTVLFVLTQTDKYENWRQTLTANHEKIARYAPAFKDAPWFAVSSRMRADAIRTRATNPSKASELDERSGFPALAEALTTRIAGQAERLRAANAGWTARRLIDKLTADTEQRLRSLAQDPRLAEEIRQRKAALNDARRADAGWLRSLDREFSGLSKELSRSYTRRLADLESLGDRLVTDAKADTAVTLAQEFDAAIRAMWADLQTSATRGATRAAGIVAAELGAGGVDALQADLPYPEQLAALPDLQLTRRTPPKDAKEFFSEYWPSVSGVSFVTMLGHLVLGAANPFLLLVSGGAVAAQLQKGNRAKADNQRAQGDLSRHFKERLGKIRAELMPALQDSMERMRAEIEQLISDRMRARDAELAAAIDQATADLQASEAELAPKRAAATVALSQLRDLREKTTMLIGAGSGEAAVPAGNTA